jgi:hypothetical protein
MRCLLAAAFLLMIFSPVAYGDLYWESVQVRSGSPKGLPAGLPKGCPRACKKICPRDAERGMPKGKICPNRHLTRVWLAPDTGPQTIKHYLSEVRQPY